jgi:hypothetical protein
LGGRKGKRGQSGSSVGSREVRVWWYRGSLRIDKPRSPTRGRTLGNERQSFRINDKEMTGNRFMDQYA